MYEQSIKIHQKFVFGFLDWFHVELAIRVIDIISSYDLPAVFLQLPAVWFPYTYGDNVGVQ
jgi:hypothetical protein